MHTTLVPQPTTSTQFGCLDCLTQENIEAVIAPLFLYAGTYLCGKHANQRSSNAPSV